MNHCFYEAVVIDSTPQFTCRAAMGCHEPLVLDILAAGGSLSRNAVPLLVLSTPSVSGEAAPREVPLRVQKTKSPGKQKCALLFRDYTSLAVLFFSRDFAFNILYLTFPFLMLMLV